MRLIPAAPNYMCTRDGRIWSVPRISHPGKGSRKVGGRWLTPRRHRSGHLRVTLTRDGAKQVRCIHQLVMETWIGPCPEGLEVRHLNSNPSDNRLENLAYGTRKENVHDMIEAGTFVYNRRTRKGA